METDSGIKGGKLNLRRVFSTWAFKNGKENTALSPTAARLVALEIDGKEVKLTIDTHRQHIMDKLGLRSVAELTKYAIREGLTSV